MASGLGTITRHLGGANQKTEYVGTSTTGALPNAHKIIGTREFWRVLVGIAEGVTQVDS